MISGIGEIMMLVIAISIGTIFSSEWHDNTGFLVMSARNGWNIQIQCIKLIATAPMNVFQAEIYEYSFVLFNAMGFAGLVMLISALLKNNFGALIGGLSIIYVPVIASRYLPFTIKAWAKRLRV